MPTHPWLVYGKELRIAMANHTATCQAHASFDVPRFGNRGKHLGSSILGVLICKCVAMPLVCGSTIGVLKEVPSLQAV